MTQIIHNKIDLYTIFNGNIEDLLSPFQDNKNLIKYYRDEEKSKYIKDRKRNRIDIAQNYNKQNLLSTQDSDLVSNPVFYEIMNDNTYDKGIEILNNYLYNSDYALEYMEHLLQYNDIYEQGNPKIDDFLSKLEKEKGRKWVVDMLLQIKPEDVNEDKKLHYIKCFCVLKYIGNVNDFRDHFNKWLNRYNQIQIGKRTDVITICNAYINKCVEYFPYIPECKEVYNKLKFLLDHIEPYIQIGEGYFLVDGDEYFLEDILDVMKLINPEKSIEIFTNKQQNTWEQKFIKQWEMDLEEKKKRLEEEEKEVEEEEEEE